VKEEIRKNEERLRNRQLRKLRIETRPAELAKLYDARKSFELRLRTSKEKYVIFIKGREVRVQRELQRRAESGRVLVAWQDWIGTLILHKVFGMMLILLWINC
jgi:hypothetical protein